MRLVFTEGKMMRRRTPAATLSPFAAAAVMLLSAGGLAVAPLSSEKDVLQVETICPAADDEETGTKPDGFKRAGLSPSTCTVRLRPPSENTPELKFNYPCGITLPVPRGWKLSAQRGSRCFRKNFSRLALHSPSAAAVRVHIRKLNLPPGEVLRIYGKKPGAAGGGVSAPPETYVERGPFGDGELWSNLVPGDTVYLEWTGSPGVVPFEPVALAHFWRSPFQLPVEFFECHLDAALYSRKESRSVVRIVYQNGSGPALCTGVLIANPSGDGAPLVLTAHHTIPTDAAARSVQAFWLYRSGDPTTVYPSPAGARIVAAEVKNDQTLLEIPGRLPRGVCYSGWTTELPPAGAKVVAWHHPGGGTPLTAAAHSVLRVSFGLTLNKSALCLPLSGVNPGLVVSWEAGTTSFGSSGSGLWWERNGRYYLIGVLSCGRAACTASPANNHDVYGRSGEFLRRAVARTRTRDGGQSLGGSGFDIRR